MKNQKKTQDISSFRMPQGFRGKPSWYVQLWWLVQATLFRWSPQFMYSFRSNLLRIFGANVGKCLIIRPSATVTYPWKVKIGDHVWIGDDVVLYSLGEITIGDNTVISQRSYICAGDHDYTQPEFPIRGPNIHIGSECWLATDTYVAPGITIKNKCVVGARSGVFKNLPEGMVCAGTPAKPIKPRK